MVEVFGCNRYCNIVTCTSVAEIARILFDEYAVLRAEYETMVNQYGLFCQAERVVLQCHTGYRAL